MIAFRTTLNVGFFGDMRTARKKVKPEMAEIAQKRYGEKKAEKEETTKKEAAVVGGAARRGDAGGAAQLRRDYTVRPQKRHWPGRRWFARAKPDGLRAASIIYVKW